MSDTGRAACDLVRGAEDVGTAGRRHRVQRNLRVSDAERQAVARRLERALRDGRPTVVEFDQRVQAAYAARNRRDLEA